MRSLKCLAMWIVILISWPPAPSAAQANRLEVQNIDGKISISAEAVGLGRLLSMFDRAAGTESTVPVELQNRNISVQFQALDFGQAVKKIFEGLPLDYVVLEQGRIVVTAVAGTLTASAGGGPSPLSSPGQATAQPFAQAPPEVGPTNPFRQPVTNPIGTPVGAGGVAPVQPAIIQTPFGPLVNPRANTQPANPFAGPAQGLPFGAGPGSTMPPGTPNGQGVFPQIPGLSINGGQGNSTQPDFFGNTAPAILDLKNPQPAVPNRSQP